jgi:hypothetical protein
MRELFWAAFLSVALWGQPGFAQNDDEHAAHHPEGNAQGAAPGAKPDGSLTQLAKNMQKIRDLMAQIHATDDPAKRDELMTEHLKAMREQMKAVLAMAPAGRKSGEPADDHAGHGAQDGKKEPKGEGMMGKGMMGGGMMMQKHKQMEGRVRMLELMLEQMIEREAVGGSVEHDD